MKTSDLKREKITVETIVKTDATKVWESWTKPEHITKWCNASADWHAPYADNDVKVGGKFKTTMAAKDGSTSFDFTGFYTAVKPNELIEYTMDDGRTASIKFSDIGSGIKISETFEAEDENSIEIQKGGWQAILDNFKKHTESIK